MLKTIEMLVSLKMPDSTAITALQTLKKLGFEKIKGLKRFDYYKFSVEGDLEKFKEKISKADIIVNANKHLFDFSVKKEKGSKLLVKNTDDDCTGLLSVLKNRLGFKSIKKIEKGVLWSINSDADSKESIKISEKAARGLLANENYQSFSVIQ